MKNFNEFLNEFGPLAGSGNTSANDLDNAKRKAAKKSERGEMVYVVSGKYGTYKLSKYHIEGDTYAAFYNGMEQELDESVVTEARAPKTKEELISALDDAYSKLEKYNTKYYEISTAPGGGSWSSNSKEGKAALKYKKMAGNQQANIWKWTDKLRKLGFEYNTNEAVVNEGQADVNKSYDKVIELIRKEARRLNDDDAYEFHERLKEFFNKTI